MKSLILALVLLTSNLALAFDFPPGTKVNYQSWCEGDKVTTEDQEGIYEAYDCYDYNRRCVEDYNKSGDWVVVTATCE